MRTCCAMLDTRGPADPPNLKPEEVAAQLSIKPPTVGVWRRQGKLPGVRLGPKTYRYRQSAVDALLDAEKG